MITSCLFIFLYVNADMVCPSTFHWTMSFYLSLVRKRALFLPSCVAFQNVFYYIVSEVKGLSSLQVWAEPTKISHPLSKLCLLLTLSSV